MEDVVLIPKIRRQIRGVDAIFGDGFEFSTIFRSVLDEQRSETIRRIADDIRRRQKSDGTRSDQYTDISDNLGARRVLYRRI